ncbi:MAG: response regulator [Lactobacillales bacterium]|jgi:response regulator NasT|nr:response regulator [Lactobacillales bacterium]
MWGRIVIADDEPMTRMDLTDMLEEKGYEVVGAAANGFEAIEICKREHPHAVLMDIQMPILNGIKATKVILRDKLASGVVFLSAYSDESFTSKAKEAGATGYLVKPVDEKSLIPTIEMCIGKGKEIHYLNKKIDELDEKLSDRKVIEKAKGILMKENQLTEEQAYKMLRDLSMRSKCKMREISDLIVMDND